MREGVVSLLEPRNVEAGDAALVPILNTTLIGTKPRWPPANVAWAGRLPRMSLQGDSELNLLVEIIPAEGASEASFQGLRVDYTVGYASHPTTSDIAVEFHKTC